MQTKKEKILALAKQTLEIQAKALERAKDTLDDNFIKAVELILKTKGRVVVMGIGKSGHVGRKIAATLASVGTPAFFVHPAEASHGDLGMISSEDAALLISNSGEAAEINTILPWLKRMKIPSIAITGAANSTLAKHADITISSHVIKEACPLNLAPTASTSVQMALGDALAVTLLDARGFNENDFARTHPGGALGRRLFITVQDIMRSGDNIPQVSEEASLIEAMHEITKKGMGACVITKAIPKEINVEGNTIAGIFTDGDLRRLLESGANLKDMTIKQVMKPNPYTIEETQLAAAAAAQMEEKKINFLLVTDSEGKLKGAINTHDLMSAKVI